ncbi:hypothetical protein IE53DRAFT_382280 [Violaceomyces palustris]|uniref:Uncharacterized protein n=1 Tax=Violaceomyces palustris TaxID=1673888 RepID=A0ACD0NN27_9BASI|nr:hypothetical protein IE53DRAFT_382280 [Violaceomyces palustris]
MPFPSAFSSLGQWTIQNPIARAAQNLARPVYDFAFGSATELSSIDPAPGLNTATSISTGGYNSVTSESLDDSMRHAWNDVSEGPWGFICSRYALALVIMALITNRIQHICRPRARAVTMTDAKRVALRLPSILLLTRSVLILLIITCNLAFSSRSFVNQILSTITPKQWRQGWISEAVYNSSLPDADEDDWGHRDAGALWAAFMATCVAVVTESLIRSLEADRDEPPSFNLVGFAFLLHFHSYSPEYPASKHVYFCVLLQLAEIWSVSISKCRKRPLVPRLPLTAFFGITSTIHYLWTVRTGNYPFMQAFNRAPEIALICVILLTIFLHALTMILLEGKIEPSRLLFTRANLPSASDDWSLALFKLGTACLESTRLTGLSREMAQINVYEGAFIEMKQNGEVRLVDEGQDGVGGGGSLESNGGLGGSRSKSWGLGREIRKLRLEVEGDGRGGNPFLTASSRWKEAVKFLANLCRVVRTLCTMASRWILVRAGIENPRVPVWMERLWVRLRLLWHGSNGEERRARRIAERQREMERLRSSREAIMDRVRGERRQQQGIGATSSISTRAHIPPTTTTTGPSNLFSITSSRGMVRGSERNGRERATSPSSSLIDQALWQRFLAPGVPIQEEEEEEEDGDWDEEAEQGEEEEEEGEEEGGSGQTDTEAEEDVMFDTREEVESYYDLVELLRTAGGGEEGGHSSSSSPTPYPGESGEEFRRLLLARLVRKDRDPPMTRSGYRSLIQSTVSGNGAMTTSSSSHSRGRDSGGEEQVKDEDEDDLLQVMIQRRRSSLKDLPQRNDEEFERERKRLCVVCCVEERNVICWPCRCLCLCMECREQLASRPPRSNRQRQANHHHNPSSSSSTQNTPTHLCPTCRTPVQAFSRLYIP